MKCKYKSISLEELQKIVLESKTYSELMKKLGYTENRGTSYQNMKKYLIENNINFSHLSGYEPGSKITKKYTLEEILVKDTPYTNMSKLKDRVLKANLLEYKCSKCGNIGEWQGEPLVLQLDHINGDNRDNRIENLRLLCPNCHSQTETFCGKNKEC